MSTNYYVCFVCDEGFTEDPHTYHAEQCPKRIDDPCQDTYECQNLAGCGEDVHPHHCPTCTGQAL